MRPASIVVLRNTSAATPNLSLNIHSQVSRWELYAAAIFGVVLQLGILVYFGVATCYLAFPKGEEPVASHAFPSTATGTFLLVFGMLLCAYIVESGTSETTYRPRPGRRARVVWLQKSGTVNDQAFEPFAIFPRNDSTIITTSHRANKVSTRKIIGLKASATELTTVVGSSISVCGFLAQYTGLHGLHWSASVAQLGATLAMTVLRAWVRRNLARRPKALPLIPGHELDWLVLALGEPTRAPWLGPAAGPFADGVIQDWKPAAIEDPTTRKELELAPQAADHGSLPKAHHMMRMRRDLGELADWLGPASVEAISLTRAIEITMNALFASLSGEHRWSVTVNGEPVYFRLKRGHAGRWNAYSDEIESALSLWLYSVHEKEQGVQENSKGNRRWRKGAHKPSSQRIWGRENADTSDRDAISLPDDDTWLRAKGMPSKPSLKILGLHTAALYRDLEWWMPGGDIDVIALKDIGPGTHGNAMEVEAHRLVGFVSTALLCPSPGIDICEYLRASPKSFDEETPLAIETFSSLKTLYAQHLFSAFIWSAVKRLKGASEDEAVVRQTQRDTISGGGSAWQTITLHSARLSKMVLDIQGTGLGSLEEVYLAIIPPLSITGKLPCANAIIEWAREHAKPHEQLGRWKEAADAYLWLFQVAQTFSAQGHIFVKSTALLMEFLKAAREALAVCKAQHFDNGSIRELEQLEEQLSAKLKEQNGAVFGGISAGLMWLYKMQGRPWQFDTKGASDSDARALLEFTTLHQAAHEDDFMHIEQVQSPATINKEDILGWTPLHHAAAKPSPSALSMLLRYQADVNAQDVRGRIPLHYACRHDNGLVVQNLLRKGADINRQDVGGIAPAHCAAMYGSQASIKALIESGANVDIADGLGNTPLLWAAYKGHTALVEELWKYSNTRLRNHNGMTPLHLAAMGTGSNHSSNRQVIELLLGKHVDTEAKARHGRTPLHFATLSGSEDVTQLLIDHGAEMEAIDADGRTPLHWAVVSGREPIARLLCSNGADKEAIDGDARTPLHLAVESGHLPTVNLLIEQGANMEAAERLYKHTPLHMAAEKGDEDMAQLLIRKGADMETNNSNFGRTPLHLAVMNKHHAVVRLLLEEGAKIDARDRLPGLEATPLHEAAESGFEVIAKLLLDNGADKDARNIQRRTPLHYAAENGHGSIVRLLLSVNAHKHAKDGFGDTPMDLAMGLESKSERDAIVKLLQDM